MMDIEPIICYTYRVIPLCPASDTSSQWVCQILVQLMSMLKNGHGNVWKGDKVGYRGLHNWVATLLGKPRSCAHCRNSSLNHRNYHWANISHEYKRDVTDWIRLCAKCHKKFDKSVYTPRKTCNNGHEYTPENTKMKKSKVTKSGFFRVCLVCYGVALETQRKVRMFKRKGGIE